jgi:dTDP-4-dehydrorhamnose 3,5-epimerase
MAYTVTTTPLPGVLLLQPRVFEDPRGYFFESYNARAFEQATGVTTQFVQDNQSRSERGVLRGLHHQTQQVQGKLVRVTHGEVFDVAVDLRQSSPTLGQWFGVRLSAENKTQLWIPPGLAHGFLVLSDVAEFHYKTTDYYAPQHEQILKWSDPKVNIAWPEAITPVLSDRDAQAPGWDAQHLHP